MPKSISIALKTSFLFLIVFKTTNPNLNLKSQTSAIQISNGSTFFIENAITDYDGKLIKENNSSLEGQNITFNNGLLEDSNNKINISGTLTPDTTNKIYLNGNSNLWSENGTLLQTIEISNFNNYINGTILCPNDITLQDINSSLTTAILNELPVNIQLNNGMIFLDKNLSFKDNKKIIGPGKIFLNNYSLSLGSKDLTFNKPLIFNNATDIQLHSNIILDEKWTFKGNDNVLSANNNIIYLGNTGALIVDTGSTLTIKDAIISGAGNSNIRCSMQTGKIFFNNVSLLLSSNLTFSSGQFNVYGNLDLNGSYTLDYQSTQQSNIKANSSLTLNDNLTFYYHPNSTSNNLLSFQDETSSLIIKNSTLHATTTHMQLTKGNLIVTENAYISCDDTGQIIFGNNNASDDFYCEFLNDARLNLTKGKLVYKNINSSSWKMNSINSVLNIYSNSTLNLQQNLNLQEGYSNLYLNSTLETHTNKYLLGNINYVNEYK